MPTPAAVLRTLLAERRFLLGNAVPTWIEAALGFLIGNTVGFLLAVAFTYGVRLRAAYFPVVLLFNTVPVLALAPTIILVFGLGLLPKVVIAALVCFFPTLVNGVRGFALATLSELELMRVLSASGPEVFWRLRLPRAAPLLFASFRVASTTCVIGAVQVVANPLINVTLQGRHDTYPKRRGLTRVPKLMAGGVNVAFGHDCVMDPWYPLGSGDMLEVAGIAVHVAQMTSPDAMRAGDRPVRLRPAAGLQGRPRSSAGGRPDRGRPAEGHTARLRARGQAHRAQRPEGVAAVDQGTPRRGGVHQSARSLSRWGILT